MPLGDVRPDILAMIGNNLVAIEVQVTNISLEEITRRTMSYSQRGIAILWILCEPVPEDGINQRFRWYQRFLHGMYFGRVYYYLYEDVVWPIHFNTVFGESGRLQTIKCPQYSDSAISLSDTTLFTAKYRESWSYETRGKIIDYPSAKLWMEYSAKWWD